MGWDGVSEFFFTKNQNLKKIYMFFLVGDGRGGGGVRG